METPCFSFDLKKECKIFFPDALITPKVNHIKKKLMEILSVRLKQDVERWFPLFHNFIVPDNYIISIDNLIVYLLAYCSVIF